MLNPEEYVAPGAAVVRLRPGVDGVRFKEKVLVQVLQPKRCPDVEDASPQFVRRLA